MENKDYVSLHKKMERKNQWLFQKIMKRSPTPRIRPHPRQDFSTWIKKRISEYDFTVNQDFTTVTKNLVNGGRYWKKSNDDRRRRKSQEYGLYCPNKSPHSDKQVEHFRYFEKADKGFQ